MRKVATGQTMNRIAGPLTELRFYSRSNEKPLGTFKQKKTMIRCVS